jgi:hypothetical protein
MDVRNGLTVSSVIGNWKLVQRWRNVWGQLERLYCGAMNMYTGRCGYRASNKIGWTISISEAAVSDMKTASQYGAVGYQSGDMAQTAASSRQYVLLMFEGLQMSGTKFKESNLVPPKAADCIPVTIYCQSIACQKGATAPSRSGLRDHSDSPQSIG